jgi:hypothetical protein
MVRTRLSRARIEFESGTALCVNRWTTLTLGEKPHPPGLSMVGGEVYVETVPADRGFWVETPHGRAVDLGTRFGVDVELNGTLVVVAEGEVEASTDRGRAEVGAGKEVRLARRTSPPEPVREATDLERRLAWVSPLKRGKGLSPADVVARFSFGPASSAVPEGFTGADETRFDPGRGYGWTTDYGPRPRSRAGPDQLHSRIMFAGSSYYADRWELSLSNGTYLVTVCCGGVDGEQGPHRAVVEGVAVISDVGTEKGEFVTERDVPVTVRDGRLTLDVGAVDPKDARRFAAGQSPDRFEVYASDTGLVYLIVKRVAK